MPTTNYPNGLRVGPQDTVTLDANVFMLPKMTTAQRDAIKVPVAGAMIYNTSTNIVQVNINGTWSNLTTS